MPEQSAHANAFVINAFNIIEFEIASARHR
jgi:hypothetical protein